jgi:hypothetical protein
LGDKIKKNEMGGPCGTYGEELEVCCVLMGKLVRKAPLGRSRRRWKYSVKIGFKEMGYGRLLDLCG